jgi:hypothetical protein
MKLILVTGIDDYIKNASEARAIPAESLQGYVDFMKANTALLRIIVITDGETNLFSFGNLL